jgi:acyl transferase domain-containing protein
MGRQLLAQEPVFRAVVERCDELVRTLGKWSLLEELNREEEQSRLDETSIAQPALFAVLAGLAALWTSWGIRPDAVIGPSGRVAAARRRRPQPGRRRARHLPPRRYGPGLGRGRMLAVGLPRTRPSAWSPLPAAALRLAAVNGPTSMTLSGDPRPSERSSGRCERAGLLQVREGPVRLTAPGWAPCMTS